jgi:hypothetical protein
MDRSRRPSPRFAARVLVALLACLCLLAPVSASAAVERSGSCSGPTHWRLVLRKGDPGELIVIFKAWGGPSGDKWNIFMENKGNGFYSTSRTSGDGGAFRVRRSTKDLSGTDKILVTANNTRSGETCGARANI